MTTNYVEHKTALTPQEKLRAAVAVLVEGVPQHVVAALFGVNSGRVAEAVTAIRRAIENDREVRSDLSGSSVEIRNMEQSDSSGARPNGALYHHDA
jgi:hypothetical protein